MKINQRGSVTVDSDKHIHIDGWNIDCEGAHANDALITIFEEIRELMDIQITRWTNAKSK